MMENVYNSPLNYIDQTDSSEEFEIKQSKSNLLKIQSKKTLGSLYDLPTKQQFEHKKQSLSDFLNTTKTKDENCYLENEQFQNQHIYFGAPNQDTTQKYKQIVSKLIGDIKKSSNIHKTQKLSKSKKSKSKQKNKKGENYRFNYNEIQDGGFNHFEFAQLKKGKKQSIKKENTGGKKLISKSRIYMCGKCFTKYYFNQQLLFHIRTKHQGNIPDGSIFGVKRTDLFALFYIPMVKAPTQVRKRAYLFKCGCGRQCSSSTILYYHIHRVHKGVKPEGTIGIQNKVLKAKST